MPRLLALVGLLVAGMLSLPLAAFFLDGEGNENWILPAQVGAIALLGAAVGVAVPGFTRRSSNARRRALAGAVWGVVMAVVGVVTFFLVLSGFDGA
ncbi:MAG: hypothetical protein J7518_06395 [Nocardioidaceae bacterium]|nr:hypothetical protein [Nocardioidaceae bacterium]